MPDLTDAELGDLLRETFTEQERLLDHLPEATKRRRSPVPVLLAAAAVLAVLAGVLYGADRPSHPAPPAATPAHSELGDVWGVAIATLASRYQPSGGWTEVEVISRNAWPSSQPLATTYQGATPQSRATPVTFSDADKAGIEQAVTKVAPVRWDVAAGGTRVQSCRPQRAAIVIVGPVVPKGDRQQVQLTLHDGCGLARVAHYVLQQASGVWTVATGVGLEAGTMPCAIATSPPEAC
ncbi:hypothetical protein AB0E69_13870 [Kribbella sp. NPDC026611]|uniref:hypothetical protein n=1 Tax=Kribbella sp. NPDC026611 TaxID=3154911 RepID=UPI0033E641B3